MLRTKNLESQMQKSQIEFNSKTNPIPQFFQTSNQFYKGAQLFEGKQYVRKQMAKKQRNNFGFEISVQPDKEKCIEPSCSQKVTQLINKFHQFAFFKLQIYYPNNLSQKERAELETEYADLGLKISQFQFQGQKSESNPEGNISQLLQMIILRQSYLPKITEDAKIMGFDLNLDYHKYICSIPTPNKQQIDFYELQNFFINNIYSKIKNYKILKVSCKTKREATIKYNLLSQLINKQPQKFENFQGLFVLLTNETLQKTVKNQKISRELVEQFITDDQIDCLYFVVNQSLENDIENLQLEFDRLTTSKKLFKFQSFKKVVSYTSTEDEIIDDTFWNEKISEFLKNNQVYQNLDIYVSDFKSTNNQVSLTLQMVEYIAINQSQNFKQQQIEEIAEEIKNIFQAYEILELSNKQILLWNYFIKQNLSKEQEIEFSEQQISDNQLNLCFIQQSNRKQKITDLSEQLKSYQVEELIFSCQQGEILSNYFQHSDKEISQFCKNELQETTQNNQNIVQIMITRFTSNEIHILIIFDDKYHDSELSQIKQNIQKQVLQELQISYIQYQSFIKNTYQQIIESYQQLIIVDDNNQFFFVYGLNKYFKALNDELKQLTKTIQTIKLKQLHPDEQLILQKYDDGLFSTDIEQKVTKISFSKSNFLNVINILEHLQSEETAFEQIVYDRDKFKDQLEDIRIYSNSNNVFLDIFQLKQYHPDNQIKIMFSTQRKQKNKIFKLIEAKISEIAVQSLVVLNYYSEKFYNDYHSRQLNHLKFSSTCRENFNKFFQSYNQKLVSSFHHQTSQGEKLIFCVWPQNLYQLLKEKKTMQEIFQILIECIFKEIMVQEAIHSNQIQDIAVPMKLITIFGQNYQELASLFLNEVQIYIGQNDTNLNQIYIVEDSPENIKILFSLFENQTLKSNVQIFLEEKNEYLPQILTNFFLSNQQKLNEKETLIKLPKIFPKLNQNQVHMINFTKKIIQNHQLTIDKLEFYKIFGRVIYFINQKQVCDEENEYLNFLQIQSKENEISFINRNQVCISHYEKNYYIHNYDFDGCQKYKITETPLTEANVSNYYRSSSSKPDKKTENYIEHKQEGLKSIIVVKGNLDSINELRKYLNSKQLYQWREIK